MLSESKLVRYVSSIKIVLPDTTTYFSHDLLSKIPQAVTILYKVAELETPRELSRFRADFHTYLQEAIELDDFERIDQTIENLAAKFESFLKIIGFVFYQNNAYFSGDVNSKGIIGTTLNGLYTGTLDPTNAGRKNQAPATKLPRKLITYKGRNQKIFDCVRDIRNKVHYSIEHPREDLINSINLLIVSFLMVIEEHQLALAEILLDEFKYADKILKEHSNESVERLYVDLFGKANIDIDVSRKEIPDPYYLLKELESYDLNDIEVSEEPEQDLYHEDLSNQADAHRITDLTSNEKIFYLIGPPGSGKSTSLARIQSMACEEILCNGEGKIPVIVQGKELSPSHDICQAAEKILGTDLFNAGLKEQNILFIIDGVNEIPTFIKNATIRQIKGLIESYPDCSFIFSDRKYNFINHFNIPVYEINPLKEVQIHDFIQKHLGQSGNTLFEQLKSKDELYELAKNPMMLKMITAISKTSGCIPNNKAKLYDLFLKTFFLREDQKKQQINSTTKLSLLSITCFKLRSLGMLGTHKLHFKDIVREAISEHASIVDIDQLIYELHDNSILTESKDIISVAHESYFEYFTGLQLMTLFKSNKIIDTIQHAEFNSNAEAWAESLKFCIDLLDNDLDCASLTQLMLSGTDKRSTKKLAKNKLEITAEDFSEHLHIIAKALAPFESEYPIAYSTFERSLQNHLYFWKKMYLASGREPCSLQYLIKSVSLFGSRKILKAIFENEQWLQIWLDEEAPEQDDKSNKKHPNDFDSISSTLVSNTSNIQDFLTVLNVCCENFYTLRSIRYKISKIKNLLLLNLSYEKLKELYINTDQKEKIVLLNMIRHNFEDIRLHEFGDDLSLNSKVISILYTYHAKNPLAAEIIYEQLASLQYKRPLIKKAAFALMKAGQTTRTVDILESTVSLLDRRDYIVIDILSQVEWSTIPVKLQEYILLPFKRDLSAKSIINKILTGKYPNVRFHKGHLFSVKNFTTELSRACKSRPTRNLVSFLCRNGMIQQFHLLISNLRYGIVIEYRKDEYCKVFFNEQEPVVEASYKKNVHFGNIVVVNYKTVYPIPLTPSLIEKLDFIQGKIVSMSGNFGFVRSDVRKGNGDYFFSFAACSFTPAIGKSVSFLPITNNKSGHERRYVATNIQPIPQEEPAADVHTYRPIVSIPPEHWRILPTPGGNNVSRFVIRNNPLTL
ncbi:NACHT domain-containing protein [Parachryseolinea silvisoli]|uniref:NACHT domain-containing protein n=1 Tax=Parachryseolinea silvisoli TaxID=2873601 RepID=UPI002265F517|nr:hypothetical protein [Parachryseolinea silvisoli]MCD9014581.1 hypothetical protein [Parachryseolinea silvisoli]